MICRLATFADIPYLAQMRWNYQHGENKAHLLHGCPQAESAFPRDCADFLRGALGNDYFCWVAEENGLIVSHIYIVIGRKLPKPEKHDGTWGYVTAVYTASEYRDQGIGTQLMERAKAWSNERGLEHLIVWPSRLSVPFYERAGFLSENDVMELPLDGFVP